MNLKLTTMKTTEFKIGQLVRWLVNGKTYRVADVNRHHIYIENGTKSWQRKEDFEPIEETI